ncbi:MAG: ATP-binding protein [Armatimonadota bacterium]
MISTLVLNPEIKDISFIEQLRKSKKYRITGVVTNKKTLPRYFNRLKIIHPNHIKGIDLRKIDLLLELNPSKSLIFEIASDYLSEIKVITHKDYKVLSGIFFNNKKHLERLIDITKKDSRLLEFKKGLDRKFLEFAITLEVSRFINAPLGQAGTVEALFNTLHRKINISACAVNFFKPDINELFATTNMNMGESQKKTFIDKITDFSKELSKKQTVLKELTHTDLRKSKKLKLFKNFKITSGNLILGALSVASVKNRLTQKEIEFITILAKQFAVFLENDYDKELLAKEKNIIESIVQSMAEGVIFVDKQQRIAIINNAAKSILNIKKEVLGRKIYTYIKNKEVLNLLDIIKSDLGNFIYKEITIEDQTRPRKRIIRCYALKTLDVHKKPLGTTLVFNDITHEKEVAEARIEFLSATSHELRTPLAAIKESIELLSEDTGAGYSDEQKHLLGISRKNIRRLATLINDLLDITKIESGKMKFNFEKSDIKKILGESVSTFEILAKEKGITLKTEINRDIPEIHIDRQRIMQVMANLLSNAVKFTKPGGEITLEADYYQYDPNLICISIEDQGVGIDKKDMPNLFKKFQQFSKTEDKLIGSTGLGLVIAKDITEQHNGNIWVESQLGKGTKFSFTIPVERREGVNKPKKILVIDNDPNFVNYITSHLEKNKFHAIKAHTGKEAIKKINTLSPDLIILDTRTPDINTYRINKFLRKTADSKKTPLIMLTAMDKEGKKSKLKTSLGDKNISGILIEKDSIAKELLKTINLLLKKEAAK